MRYSHSARLRALLALLPALAASPTLAGDPPAKVPELKTFRDWMVGCDNVRRCTAIGLPSGRTGGGYVVVKRDGAGEADIQISLVVRTEEAIKTPIELSILMDGQPVDGMPHASYPMGVDKDDIYTARLEIAPEDGAVLVHQMRDGKSLDLQVTGPGRATVKTTISLVGAAAALLYMDVDQLRTGTVTGIIGSGPAPASSITPVPHLPVVQALPMQDVPDPSAAPPAGVAPNLDDCSGSSLKPSLTRLSAQAELWGMCYVSAAYNVLRRYWISDGAKATEASFLIPGRQPPAEGPGVLANAQLAPDGRVLESLALGRGLGDCGTHSMWAWTGSAFQLTYLAEMTDCRGVPASDWPVLYTSRWP